jgi:hypothetical protein
VQKCAAIKQFTADVTAQDGAAQTVTWSVDGTDSNIDASGLLTVGANETATMLTVTATSTYDTTKKGAAMVTVIRPVSGITVTGGDSISAKGGTLRLTANVTPANADNKAVTWTSGDTGIAAVDANGLVTAVANGAVTITATARDGSNVSGAISVTVTGQDAPAPIQYPVLSAFPAFTGTGGGDRTATVDADRSKFTRLLYGGNAVDPGNYTVTEGSTVITLNENYLKTLANGTHTFRAEFTNGYADLTLTVKAEDNTIAAATTGVPRTGDESDLSIWIALCVAAGVGIAGIPLWRKRRQTKG